MNFSQIFRHIIVFWVFIQLAMTKYLLVEIQDDSRQQNPYGSRNLQGTQCFNGTARSPWDNCNRAICDSNHCVSGATKMGCWVHGKGENDLCVLKQNNCREGLKCVDQEDGCDNGVGRCEKSDDICGESWKPSENERCRKNCKSGSLCRTIQMGCPRENPDCNSGSCKCKETRACCMALTASCLSCAAGVTKEEYCKLHPKTRGCVKIPKCPGDLVYSNCHGACENVCGEKEVSICTKQCVSKCACPLGLYRSSKNGTRCFEREKCPKIDMCMKENEECTFRLPGEIENFEGELNCCKGFKCLPPKDMPGLSEYALEYGYDVGTCTKDNFETKCKPGTSRPAGDGCNTCICIEGEAWACTEMACKPDQACRGHRDCGYGKNCVKGNCKRINESYGGKQNSGNQNEIQVGGSGECPGDLVYNLCNSACPPVCGENDFKMCTRECRSGCGCPKGQYILPHDDNKCVNRENCPETVYGKNDGWK